MTLANVSSVLAAQILFRGRAIDALTLSAPRSRPSATLFYRTPPGAAQRPYPLAARVNDDGTFVFSGDPHSALPQPVLGETLDLRLTISALGYQERHFDFALDAANLTRTEVERELNGQPVPVRLLDAPLWSQDVALDPVPIHLYGRVVRADDMSTAVAGAEVLLTDPAAPAPVVTDGNGAFAIRALPLMLRVGLRITREGFADLETNVALDYREPVNQHQFALESLE